MVTEYDVIKNHVLYLLLGTRMNPLTVSKIEKKYKEDGSVDGLPKAG